MEILLNEPDAGVYVESMRTNAWKLELSGIDTEISGQSEAIERFVSTYQNFMEALSAYRGVLTDDIRRVANAVSTLTEADKEQGQEIGALGISGLLENP